jgi:hypothetical protein
MEINGTHDLLVYADYVNMMREKIDNIMKNTEALLEARNRHREN